MKKTKRKSRKNTLKGKKTLKIRKIREKKSIGKPQNFVACL
jgi:hypothetical protein